MTTNIKILNNMKKAGVLTLFALVAVVFMCPISPARPGRRGR
jgi:hypothetical protein